MDKIDAVAKKVDELAEVVVFIKDKMATKEDLTRVENKLENKIGALENKVDNLIDQEVDRRKALEVRVGKLEASH